MEGAHRVGGNLLGELVALHVDNWRREVLCLLGAVTHNHNLVKEVGVLFKDDAGRDGRGRERLRGVAYAAYLYHGIGAFHHEEEIAVQARGGAVLGTGFHHRCADDRAQGVLYNAFYLILGKGSYARQHEAQCY